MSDLPKRSSKRNIILGLVGGYTLFIPETIREHIDENIYANISVKNIYVKILYAGKENDS